MLVCARFNYKFHIIVVRRKKKLFPNQENVHYSQKKIVIDMYIVNTINFHCPNF